jgi:riboflavin synthase
MFTGIVEETGTIVSVTVLPDDARTLAIRADRVLSDSSHGDSISVNGVCLTVVEKTDHMFTVDVMKQTLDHSTLGTLDVGSPVNLERAARVDSRLGGHIVQGHVDGVGTVVAISPSEHWTVVALHAPQRLLKYVVAQGSITVNGVSLTVASVNDATEEFTVSLIPTTLDVTTLGSLEVGDHVNLEVDVIAKYVERLVGQRD